MGKENEKGVCCEGGFVGGFEDRSVVSGEGRGEFLSDYCGWEVLFIYIMNVRSNV